MNQHSIDKITEFVDRSNQRVFTRLFNEIPTGVILGGINAADQDVFYDCLGQELRKKYPMAVLKSGVGQTIRGIMKTMMEQFMSEEHLVVDERELTLQESIQTSTKPGKIADYDIVKLVDWASLRPSTPMVLLIPNFETFDVQILKTLILILGGRKKHLPIVLLLGVATGVDSIHQALPGTVISRIAIEKFNLEHANECVNQISRQVVMKGTLRFGAKAFSDMIEQFQLRDMSVSRFIKSMQVMKIYLVCLYGALFPRTT